jgi:HEAT repeat protein
VSWLTVQKLSRRLASSDPQERICAATSLGGIHARGSAELLVQALDDASPRVRSAAQEALTSMGEVAIPFLMPMLESGDERRMELATSILIRMGGDAIAPLIEELKHENSAVRQVAVWSLGQIGDLRTIEPIRAALRDWDQGVRTVAVFALARVVRPATGPLIELLQDWNESVRCAAAKALGELSDPESVVPLAAAVADKETAVREAAVAAIARIGGRQAAIALVDILVSVLRDSATTATRAVLAATQRAIGKLREEAMEPLAQALQANTDPDVRLKLIALLGAMGDTSISDALIAALSDPHTYVRGAAADELTQIGWQPANTHQRALHAVANRNWDDAVAAGPAAADPLASVLADTDRQVRLGAIRALARIGSPDAAPLLIPLLSDAVPEVAINAALALGRLQQPIAVEPLIASIENPDLSNAALEALARIGDVRAVPEMLAALGHGSPDKKLRILESLRKFGPRVVPPLMNLRRDPDPEIRLTAEDVLEYLEKA